MVIVTYKASYDKQDKLQNKQIKARKVLASEEGSKHIGKEESIIGRKPERLQANEKAESYSEHEYYGTHDNGNDYKVQHLGS